MGSRARAQWLARKPEAAPRDIASLIPKAVMMIDGIGNISHSALKSILHISDYLLGALPLPTSLNGILHVAQGILHFAGARFPGNLPTSLQGITHLAEQGILHIADNALGGANLPPAASGILHLAEQAITHTSLSGTITHASLGGAINLVQQTLTIGAPSAAYLFDATTPPTPSAPTNVNVIGSLSATIGISAPSISIGAGGGGGGAPVMTRPQPPPIVTGAKGGNVALKNLLIALAGLGLITDNTTA
jgi:hypothetical protein